MSEPSVDLSLCSECWLPYDAEEHEPKLIKCPSHPLATYCLQCLKVKIKLMSLAYMCINVYITLQTGKACATVECETCRNAGTSWSLDELPVNVYALQLAQLKKMNIPTP